MSSNMNTKVRLVICPRCRNVLPEMAEVPVYKCGGCGAVLQAKNRKIATKNTAQDILESDPTQKHKLKQASEDKEASSSNQQSSLVSTEETDKNSDRKESTDYVMEQQPGCTNHSDEPRSSTELSSHENAESSPEARTDMGSDEEKTYFRPNNRRVQDESGDSDVNVSNEICSSSELNYQENEPLTEQVDLECENGSEKNEFGDGSGEFPATSVNCLEENFSSSELTCREAVINTEVNEDSKRSSNSTFKSLIAEKLLDTRPRKSSMASRRSLDEEEEEETLSDNIVVSPDNQHVIQEFERVNSVDTLEDVPFNNPSSDLSVGHRSYYGYYGSVSSFDGNDDQVPDLHLFRSERNFVGGLKGLPKRDNLGFDNIRSSKLGKGYHAKNVSKWSNGIPQPAKHDSKFLKPSNDPELEKIELLRMVHELQDQLNRTTLNSKEKEKQIPSYYDHLAAEREMYHAPNYSRYPGRYGQGKIWSQPQPRMAFSGETAHNRNQLDCSCFHCCPQDHHFSAQFPPHVICFNKVHHGAHPSHGFYNHYQSGPSSPQHNSGSEFSIWSYDTKSEYQRLRKDRARVQEKHHSSKRHFRPIAGGAPWVACYQCSEILQLPADFLLFKRRYHSLRCSACSKVLKFSPENRTHVVRYSPEAVAPPSSEVDDYTDPIFRSASRASYVDDYGQSFRKMSSHSSSEPLMEDKKKKSVLQDFQNRYKDSAGPLSSEIEEILPTSGSPLHRLMGYSSPSKVMRG